MKRTTLSILAVTLGSAACGPLVTPNTTSSTPSQLTEELGYTTMTDALANFPHFRPLCDAQGYPLVGNINGKIITEPSQFCAEVRKIEHAK